MTESSHSVVPWQIRAEGVLPCAFCGGPPHFMPATDVYDDDFVTCSNPECFVRETSAIPHRWNSRPKAVTDDKHVFKAAPNHELGGDRLCVRCGGEMYDLDRHYTYEEARARRSNIY
jgi:hypothetical protein